MGLCFLVDIRSYSSSGTLFIPTGLSLCVLFLFFGLEILYRRRYKLFALFLLCFLGKRVQHIVYLEGTKRLTVLLIPRFYPLLACPLPGSRFLGPRGSQYVGGRRSNDLLPSTILFPWASAELNNGERARFHGEFAITEASYYSVVDGAGRARTCVRRTHSPDERTHLPREPEEAAI